MNKTKVAVTGANGFIGSYLCRLLEREHYTVIPLTFISRQGVREQRICDITDEVSLNRSLSDADIVVHLAAISNPTICNENFDLAYKVNVEGTRNVIKCASSKHVIFASSSHVYGNPANGNFCSEADQLKGRSPYAITKIMAELLCNNYSENYNHSISIARFFNIYGEMQESSYVIPQIINQAISTKKISVKQQNVVRDFLYIQDAASAVLAIIKNKKPRTVYNIGSGIGTSISQIIDYVTKTLGKISVENLDLMTEPKVMIANNDRIKNLGWKQNTKLEDGLEKVIEFYLKFC